MQLPGKNASSPVYLDFAEHVIGATEAWGGAEILKPDQQKAVLEIGQEVGLAIDALRGAEQTAEGAARAAIRARARFRVRDIILDIGVHRLSDAVYNGPAGRSREHPFYVKVFRGAPAGKITKMKARDEPKEVARLLDRLDAVEDFDGKAPARDNLANALKKSNQELELVSNAETTENSAVDAELLARLQLRAALETAYGKLVAAFPGQRDFVESFFPKRETGKDDASTEEGEGASDGADKKGGSEAPP